jgi:predicted SprT family Zn-dependent metalloprotease
MDLLIEYNNPFHIKHLIAHYSFMRQLDEYKPIIEYFDQIVEATPLKLWQKYLLVGRIEGVSQTTLAVQIAQVYGKILSPSYMSQVMRNIYSKIAEQAEIEYEKFLHMHQSWAWETCGTCGCKKHYKEYRRLQLDRAENGKSASCKQCEEKLKK